ncbi:hypothetical protein [Leclercia adecarboxylata]|uniref:hypothetical protein n=1 Tax=Leclercia adecarboxylata TaxID=83655 RepID=UPI0022E3470F|nr:hypothetical protein [Leclercia adecarboxylata]
MSYVFLIMVITSNSSNMQIEPMESMEQCQAAIQAIGIANEQRTWRDVKPRVDNVKCIEVK